MKRAIIGLVCLAATSVQAADLPSFYQRQATWPASMIATRQNVARFHAEGRQLPADKADWNLVWDDLARRFFADWPQTDWFLQDQNYRADDDEFQPHTAFGWYFGARPDAQAEQQMIRRVLAELESAGSEFAARLDTLAKASASSADPAWLELYADACQARRARRLRSLHQQTPQFVFTKHYTLGGSHYAYTEGQSDAQAERHFVPGTALCLAVWDGDQFRVETLLEDAGGVIRDPDVASDGRRVLFSWKKSDREDDYHLYELDLTTRAVRQLTAGLGVADYEAAYLPDGDIIFNSTRCVQTVDCWWTEVSNLYRCDRDGRFLRRLTFDQVHDNYPTVTDDGRILYTRWEYNDRGQLYPQPLLQMNPDGTRQADFYGGNSWFPTTIMHARGIPGTQQVVAIASGHHSRQTGKLIVIDPSQGRQENQGVQLIAPVRDTPAVKVDAYGQKGELFQYPYPLSDTEFLAAYHPAGWRWAEGKFGPRFGVYWVHANGARERLADDPRWPSNQAIPVRARPAARMQASQVDYRQSTGTFYVQDVYAGPGLTGVPRGTIKTLRVVGLEFRAAGVGNNYNGGPAGGALVSTPVSVGNGTWDVKWVLGDATVREDGSVYAEVPARTPLYFQLLDERGRMVQSMRSWTTLQPGENASCVGCHEHKNNAPVTVPALTAALRQPVEMLRPFHGSPRGFSYAREIQPILARHCVRCHDGRPDVPYALTDRGVDDPRAKRRWNESYLALTHAKLNDATHGAWLGTADDPLVCWISSQTGPPMQPAYSAGANCSRLLELLDRGHHDVRLSREELEKLAAWIDLGVPYCGDYVEANIWSQEEREKHERYAAKRNRLQQDDQRNIAAWLEHLSQRPSPLAADPAAPPPAK